LAAPTDVRVEAVSRDTAVLRWAYAGSGTVAIHRSTDGSVYSVVTTVASTVLTYEDSGLVVGTKYWYKLSDDDGSTFSSVVTVWTHSCFPPAGGVDTGSMPRWLSEQNEEWLTKFNEMAERIEAALGQRPGAEPCITCPVDGRVELDCSSGCVDWVIVVDQDVNSISIEWCKDGSVTWIVPPNTTRKICGWPRGQGFSGDECFQAPIAGGPEGRSQTTSFGPSGTKDTKGKKGYGPVGGSGGGAGAGACVCTPTANNKLTIKCCTPDCSIKCATTKSIELRACGGKEPYNWTKTGSLVLSKTTGDKITVTPPANSGSAVAGNAYALLGKFPMGDTGSCIQAYIRETYGCNDQVITSSCITASCHPTDTCTSGSDITNCSQLACVACTYEPVVTCNGAGHLDCKSPCASGTTGCKICQSNCASVSRGKTACDKRSAGMVSAGCNPCGMSTSGTTVTVTDAVGTAVTITIKA
jgi:hypothetical protein